jgi:hypothetical protein
MLHTVHVWSCVFDIVEVFIASTNMAASAAGYTRTRYVHGSVGKRAGMVVRIESGERAVAGT